MSSTRASKQPTAWELAQQQERAFHCNDDGYIAVRRKFEQQKRAQYSGLMLLNEDAIAGKRILDIGCGPESLLISVAGYAEGCVALDPLTFTEQDEARYAAAGIERAIIPAEQFDACGKLFDEVWIYNCLQHVQDPAKVCEVAQSATKGAVRIFEYINVPTDELHLHTLQEHVLDEYFRGMNCYSKIIGSMRLGGAGSVNFYAACFLHRSIDPEHWL